MICLQQNIPCILVGPPGSGKSTILEHVASVSGKSLVVFPLNADIDTMDLVGGFEQVDPQRAASAFLQELNTFISSKVLASLPAELPEEAISLLQVLQNAGPISRSLFLSLAKILLSLQTKTKQQEFGDLATTCQRYADNTMTLENARFEWVDGVLVKALEEGKWLVLDNANLCSASVLDRLNSLLEPNGFLSINEHCGPDGEPKIVRPHSDFRIVLTMDARFGELSRAMRNRAIEIYLEPLQTTADSDDAFTLAKLEANMQRFQNIFHIFKDTSLDANSSKLVHGVALDNLSWSDMTMVSRFAEMTRQAYPIQYEAMGLYNLYQAYLEIYLGAANQNVRSGIGNALGTIATKSSLAPAGFRDAQVSDRAVLLDIHLLIVAIKLDYPSTPKLSLSIALCPLSNFGSDPLVRRSV
jgi:midasin (ATPase involved in ribosome maturation)